MRTAPESITELDFQTLPKDQGQPHRRAWAYDEETDRLVVRSFNWDNNGGRLSNLRHEYHSYRQGRRGNFDPVNGEINPIGKGRFEGAGE